MLLKSLQNIDSRKDPAVISAASGPVTPAISGSVTPEDRLLYKLMLSKEILSFLIFPHLGYFYAADRVSNALIV